MMQRCEYIVFVCSPMLKRTLHDSQHELISMQRGKFYADVVVNYISPHKFIPVFLNVPARDEWVPMSLQTATFYELPVNEFCAAVGDTEGMHPLQFERKMSYVLDDPRFESIAALIATLRKEPLNPRPKPPTRPVRPPLQGRGLFRSLISAKDENPYMALGEEAGKVLAAVPDYKPIVKTLH